MTAKQSTRTNVVAHGKGLANTFRRIQADAERLEGTANHILRIISELNVRNLATFDELVRDAYRQNGWNERPGRPSAEAGTKAVVPPVVRTYVSEVRAAFRLGLRVQRFDSFYQLRAALRDKRERLEGKPAAIRPWPTLRGVNISSPDKLNGALFHDLIVIYDHLDEDSGVALERALERLLAKYRDLAGALAEIEPSEEAAA